jgi:hypothetical protein
MFWPLVQLVGTGLLILGWLAGAGSAAAQTSAYVQATTWLTAAQPSAATQGHPRHLFLDQEASGGDPVTDRYYQSVKLSADLRKGRMSGEATILNPFEIGMRRTELRAHFQPRYQVERAPGNNTSTVIPVEWSVRLRKYALNYTQMASGSSDSGSTDARLLLSVQSPSAGGMLAQAIYHHQSQYSSEQGQSFTVTKTVQTAGASQVQEGYNFDPVSETLTNYFKIATANNGNSLARIDHKPGLDSNNGFGGVNLTVRHNALPGNGVTFFIWLEMTTVAGAYGGGTALNWDDFEIGFSLPEGYQIVALDGQDLSHLDAGQPATDPPATVQTISSWQWQPEAKRMTLAFPGLNQQPLEVQETEDFSRWNTIRRIESSSASELLEVALPAGDDGLRIPADRRFYRVVMPAE